MLTLQPGFAFKDCRRLNNKSFGCNLAEELAALQEFDGFGVQASFKAAAYAGIYSPDITIDDTGLADYHIACGLD